MMLRNLTKKAFFYGWIYFFIFCTSCASLFIYLDVHLNDSASSRYLQIVGSNYQEATTESSFTDTETMTFDEDWPFEKEIIYEEFKVRFKGVELTYNMSTPQSLDACDADLFIFVLTRPSAFSERRAIRNSWAANLTKNVVLRFIVGKNDDPTVSEMTISEQEAVGDLILYDIEDSYANLYLKVYAGLQYQQAFCDHAKYVLKTDDDTVVDVDRLMYWINNTFDATTEKYPASIFGRKWNGTKVIRDKSNKWYVPEDVYPNETYPAYVNGGTYLLTSTAVSQMLDSTPYVKPITIEDVLFTGVVAEHAMVYRQNAAEFFRNGNEIQDQEPCDPQTKSVPYLTAVYSFTSAEMPKAYESLRNVKWINDTIKYFY